MVRYRGDGTLAKHDTRYRTAVLDGAYEHIVKHYSGGGYGEMVDTSGSLEVDGPLWRRGGTPGSGVVIGSVQ